jgi:hypothetical protein
MPAELALALVIIAHWAALPILAFLALCLLSLLFPRANER